MKITFQQLQNKVQYIQKHQVKGRLCLSGLKELEILVPNSLCALLRFPVHVSTMKKRANRETFFRNHAPYHVP